MIKQALPNAPTKLLFGSMEEVFVFRGGCSCFTDSVVPRDGFGVSGVAKELFQRHQPIIALNLNFEPPSPRGE